MSFTPLSPAVSEVSGGVSKISKGVFTPLMCSLSKGNLKNFSTALVVDIVTIR